MIQRENGERLLMNQSKQNKNEDNNVNENFMQREKNESLKISDLENVRTGEKKKNSPSQNPSLGYL